MTKFDTNIHASVPCYTLTVKMFVISIAKRYVQIQF